MEKFTKLREGDFWVLDTQTEKGVYSEALAITYNKPEKIEGVSVYLWGTDDEFSKHGYTTPRDFLVATVKKTFSAVNAQDLVDDKFIDKPQQGMGIYTVTVNKKTDHEQCISGFTPNEAVINALPFLSNAVLMEIINQETMEQVVPVYCLDNDKTILTTNENYPDVQQIGYALVDVVKMEAETVADNPADVVDEYLDNLDDDSYGYEYYIWDDESQSWQYESDGSGFVGDNPVMNGFFEDVGEDWADARLDEYFIEEEEEGKGETIASFFDDNDDDDWDWDDWDDDDIIWMTN